MAKRNAEDAGLNEPQNEENNEEHDEHEDEYEQGVDNASNEGGSVSGENDDASDDSSDSTPDAEYMRGFALSWLEDKRLDGIAPQTIFESLGMKLKMDNLEAAEQWDLLEKVVTSEGVARSIFRSLFTNHRHKLPNINTLEDVIELIRTANNIVVLTGAGVSVSCGIPDFRSPGGLYAVIEEKYNLPEPQCLFDIHYLRDDPHPFFEFAPVSDFASLTSSSESTPALSVLLPMASPLSSVLPSPTLTPSLPTYDLADLDPIPPPPSIVP